MLPRHENPAFRLDLHMRLGYALLDIDETIRLQQLVRRENIDLDLLDENISNL